MNRPTIITVTDQSIDLSGLSPKAWEHFENLAIAVRERYYAVGKPRVIFALAGPSGAGKSVVSAIITHLLSEMTPAFQFINVSLDAYHYPNQTLADRGLKAVKGRYDTYDIPTLICDLVDFKAGKKVQFPNYSRQLHEPIPKNIICESDKALLWLEGGWLLYPEGGWRELAKLYDYSYFITASEIDVSKHILNRHLRGGRDLTDAKNFYEHSDAQNIKLILEKSLSAKENMIFWQDIK